VLTPAITAVRQGGHAPRPSGEAILALAAGLAVLAGLLMASTGVLALAGVVAFAIFVAIVMKPQFGAYFLLITTPLIVGVARGDIIPVLRPNEVSYMVVLMALATRILLLTFSGIRYRPAVNHVDVALVLLATASSILPMMLRNGRGLSVTTDDVLYATVLWKYLLLFWAFRYSVTTPSQVAACLWLSMFSAAVVAVVGILQVKNLFGVPELLATYYDQPFSGWSGTITERATSTIAFSFGVADVMVMNFAIAIALLQGRRTGRAILIAAAGLFVSGCIAAGQFSGFIGLGIALLAIGVITRRALRILTLAAPVVVIVSIGFWPVIENRLAGFDTPTGLPQSWETRWDNLQQFFFPVLFSGLNWLGGVQPAPRLPAPPGLHNWTWVYIESGYIWLLWIGGVPLALSFIWFTWVSLRHSWRVSRERTDAVAVAATASLTFLWVVVILMFLDPHLTMRGSADLFFPLLAMSFAGGTPKHDAPIPRAPGPAPPSREAVRGQRGRSIPVPLKARNASSGVHTIGALR
jgi:hypothetical protein